ncbi:MAG: MarR family transcriptional regulator [Gemmatimonadetes bacterium]|nr:MarR family transcriptional regulator [Gemmatimonadota bacterium]
MKPQLRQRVAAVRRFNRFYTRQIGLLNEGFLESPFSLTEVRVLYELAHREGPTATELVEALGLDAGYLSRILRGFAKRGFISRQRSAADGRRSHLALTPTGRRAFAALDARQRDEVAALLGRLPDAEQQRLVEAMHAIAERLGARPEPKEPLYLLRAPHPGDLGWVIQRHGALYAQEYGWDEQFEALVAEIVAQFLKHFDPKRERCWIAERDGQNVGSVFLVKKSATVAQLRLLLVEPSARGLGLGKRLVQECTRFARQAGYRKITLWTQTNLLAARDLYRKEGYRSVHTGKHHSFGHDLVEEVWELAL